MSSLLRSCTCIQGTEIMSRNKCSTPYYYILFVNNKMMCIQVSIEQVHAEILNFTVNYWVATCQLIVVAQYFLSLNKHSMCNLDTP